MNDDHQAHLQRILRQFRVEMIAKYKAGQQEHGGRLWQKRGMLAQMKAEAIDQVVYTLTLEEQIPAVAQMIAQCSIAECQRVLRTWLLGRTE